MAEASAPAGSDRDLASIAEARALARRAKQAWLELVELSQERIDAIVDAMAAAAIASMMASIFSCENSASSSQACLARRASARASAIEVRSRSEDALTDSATAPKYL